MRRFQPASPLIDRAVLGDYLAKGTDTTGICTIGCRQQQPDAAFTA